MKITSNKLSASVICPTSKSYGNRALILGALSKKDIILHNLPKAQDTSDLVIILKELGLDLKFKDQSLSIVNSFPECELHEQNVTELSGSEGGTTIRFLLPFLALGKNKYSLPLKGGMQSRPLRNLLEVLTKMGASISSSHSRILIQGPIICNTEVEVDCSETTQFASALELLKLNEDFNLKPLNLVTSKKYFDLTKKMTLKFKDLSDYEIPPDFSSLGYYLAYASLNQDLYISNIFTIDLDQADSYMIELLQNLGVNITVSSNKGLFIKRCENIMGFNIDGSICIDLVPTLIFLASFAKTPSTISNISILRFKECDRLTCMIDMLDFFKVSYEYDEELDKLVIIPMQSYPLAKVDSFDIKEDHRMLMVFTLFLKQLGGGNIEETKSVNKSFPDFFRFFA